MKDWIDIVKQFGLPVTPWVLLVILLLYIFRDRLNKGLNALLDWLGTVFRGKWSQRRFERTFRPAIRGKHLYMRVVGIHAEKGREPTIPEAYVPLHLAPYLDESLVNQPNRRGAPGNPSIAQSLLPDELLPVENILQRHTQLVVLGDPGAGKSTLLKHLVISFTEPQPRQRVHTISPRRFLAFKRFQRSRSIVPCPFYISLRSCRTQNNTLLEDILDPETKILEGMLPSNQRKKMPKRFIERCVEEGRAILLLDGLDEVTNEDVYEDVVRKINDFLLSYPDNRIVVTCRIAGWHRGLPDFALYRAMPLDRQQQHTFISRWYQTAYKQNASSDALLEEEKSIGIALLRENDELSASEESDALERLFKERDRLAELAANPMLLSLICLVYHLQRDLPRGRAALYDECVQILLGVWDRVDKGLKIIKPSMDEKRKILRHVAHVLHSTGQKDISRQDFVRLVMDDLGISQDEAHTVVRQIEVRSWMIVERVIDRLAFSHLTLQEFFVVEYLQIEQQNRIDFATITDWNIWREPILLMCGKSADPTTFIERLITYHTELALLCILEADNTLLNLQRIHPLLDTTLEKVGKGQFALIDMIPALVGLMSIDKSPFSRQIMDFVKAYFHTFDAQGRADLITTIANCGTREAARLLLYLRDSLPDQRPNILNGLVLIGGVAVEEALLSCLRNELSEAALKVLLLRSYAPEATQALWERYGLNEEAETTEEVRVEWAESWAYRLALPENDRLMRAIAYNGSIDPGIWPYRKSQRTALAAIVQRCVQILRGVYGGKGYNGREEAFVCDVERIARFDLRAQAPLLVQLKFPADFLAKSGHEQRVNMALRFDPSSRLWPLRVLYLKERAWYTLMAAKGKKSNKNVWRQVVFGVGAFGQAASCVLGWAGIIVLFLLHGISLWLFAGIVLALNVIAFFLAKYGDPEPFKGDLDAWLGYILGPPALIFLTGYIFIWTDGVIEAERLLATGKMKRWYPIVSLIMIIGYGLLGGFAVQAWLHLSLLLSMFAVVLLCLICTVLQGWMGAFTRESMFYWLEKHPHGHVVLDEFQE